MPVNICTKETYLELKRELEEYKSSGIKIDMRRGRPDCRQLSLSNKMLRMVPSEMTEENAGIDIRNYGGSIAGLPCARKYFAEILDVDADEIIIGGNSSLNMMYECISFAMLRGVAGGGRWLDSEKIKFLCPAPGYDRHFNICEKLGIEMITVKLNEDGPDMDTVERLVSEDSCIKGIWCVPQYSNPSGIIYSDEVVERMARLKPAAKDFRIFWDNSYCIHHLYFDNIKYVKNIIKECEAAGNPDMVYMFASTSKVTFAGSGLAVIASSKANIKHLISQFGDMTIGFDKINQQKHVDFLVNRENTLLHMQKQADLIRPKFEAFIKILHANIKNPRIATWSKPRGGYFINVNVMPGCAAKVVAMAAEAGVLYTEAGATYPYKIDPNDSNIRIAPTVPSVAEIKISAKVLSICSKIAAYEKLAAENNKK